VSIRKDVSFDSVAAKLVDCDFIFLCADTMRARLVVNAVVNQHLIAGVQIGSTIEQFYSVVRQMRPGIGCLICNGLISPHRLALEEKTERERRLQDYGTAVPNPSVIALNGIGASRATHDFLLDFVASELDRPSAAVLSVRRFQGNLATY
jgi:hypothetical protein